MFKSYKYRIYPNKKQESLLNQTFGCVRKIWNYHVEIFNKYDPIIKQEKPSNITQLRNKYSYMKTISYDALQQKERDFAKFRNSFFSKTIKKRLNVKMTNNHLDYHSAHSILKKI